LNSLDPRGFFSHTWHPNAKRPISPQTRKGLTPERT
jgi:hypothetical protein